MNYTKNLPNFICVQVTRRYVDASGKGTDWHHMDTITAKLSYDGHQEEYDVILKNDQPVTNVKMEQLGGTVSAGEFGTMMKRDFRPAEPGAVLDGTIGRRCAAGRTYVFSL